MTPPLLFGTRVHRTAKQVELYRQLRDLSIHSAFPHIAACWVGPCWGTTMLTPHHVKVACRKIAVWRCSRCLQEFEMIVMDFVNKHGECPLCGQRQQGEQERYNSDGTEETSMVVQENGSVPMYTPAPRITHAKYKSVLLYNPEWDGLNVQPMLANRWDTVSEVFYKPHKPEEEELLLVSPKIDGIRCLIGYNKSSRTPQFFSRGGILLECCDTLVPYVMPLFEADPSLMLDGELFAPTCSFEELSGIARRLKTTTNGAHPERSDFLEYYAFDIMHSKQLSSPNAPYSERYCLLKRLIPDSIMEHFVFETGDNQELNRLCDKKIRDTERKKIFTVPAAAAYPREMDRALKVGCELGFEGIIIRRPSFPYEHGKRSFGLFKYKEMQDSEYRIVSLIPGKGKFEGCLGAFLCETEDGTRFNATPKTTYANRKELWNRRQELVGQFLTVQYQQLTPQNVPRFPIAKCVRGGAECTWL
ncbi:putative DNA ligase [Trypanosoma vivax]|nr:putative DNA ligase [Trypanosoma vivax]